MRKSIKKVLFGAMVLGSACALQSCYFDSTDCYRRDVCTPVEVCEDVCSSYCDFWGCYDVCDTYCHMDEECYAEDYCYAQPECWTSADCRVGYVCSAEQICVVDVPVTPPVVDQRECVTNADCQAVGKDVCLTEGPNVSYCTTACFNDNGCSKGNACYFIANSVSAGVCLNNSFKDCAFSSDCPDSSMICDYNRCIPSCRTDRDCESNGGGFYCRAGMCVQW